MKVLAALIATSVLVGVVYLSWPGETRPQQFVMAQQPSPTATSIDVLFEIGCKAFDSTYVIDVEETTDAVIISVEEDVVEYCTDMLVFADDSVELDERVGDRRIIDAATGRDVHVADAEYLRGRPSPIG